MFAQNPDVLRNFYKVKRTTISMMRLRGYDTSEEDALNIFGVASVSNIIRFRTHYTEEKSNYYLNTGSFASSLNNIYYKINKDTGEKTDTTLVYFFDRPGDVGKAKDKKGKKKDDRIYTTQVKELFQSYVEYIKGILNEKGKTIEKYIIVLPVPLNSTSQNRILESINDVEFFDWNFLIHENINFHKYVPHYHKLTEKEKKELFNGFLPSNLPKILISNPHNVFDNKKQPDVVKYYDPLAKYNGWQPGDVIKFTSFTPASTFLIQKTVEYRIVTY